jgi:hypothetical protein
MVAARVVWAALTGMRCLWLVLPLSQDYSCRPKDRREVFVDEKETLGAVNAAFMPLVPERCPERPGSGLS